MALSQTADFVARGLRDARPNIHNEPDYGAKIEQWYCTVRKVNAMLMVRYKTHNSRDFLTLCGIEQD